jgi:hypothetical protein
MAISGLVATDYEWSLKLDVPELSLVEDASVGHGYSLS